MNSPIKNEYSIREKFQLGWWLLKTKLPVHNPRGGVHRLRQRPDHRCRLSFGGLQNER